MRAGVAAALPVKQGRSIKDVDYSMLHGELLRQGVRFGKK